MRSLVPPSLPIVVPVIWSRTRPVRDFHHRSVGCPTSAARAARMLTGTPVPAGCEDCYDVLVDCLLRLRDRADDPAAYAGDVARAVCVDRMRQANAALHGVSRPERRDGVVGRIRAALVTLPGGGWLDQLLTLLLRAAAARGPVPRTTWQLDALAEARAAAGAAPGDLRAEIELVLATIQRVAGPAWYDAHIAAPIRARTARFTTLRVGAPDTPDVPAEASACPDGAALADAFWMRLTGDAPAAARTAAAELTGRVPARPVAARLAALLVADLPELRAAYQAEHGRPTYAAIRAAVGRHRYPAVGTALDEPTVRAVHRLAHRIPLERVARHRVS